MLVCDRPARLQRPFAAAASAWSAVAKRGPGDGCLLANGATKALAEQALSAALGNPGLAMRAIREETLDLREQCRDDLAQLGKGRRSALAVAESWAADRPELRLWHAAALVRDETRALASAGRSGFGLTGAREIPKLAAWFAAANRSRNCCRRNFAANWSCLTCCMHGNGRST